MGAELHDSAANASTQSLADDGKQGNALRVCIDATPLRNVVTGLGTYARHLIHHLALLDADDEYVVLLRDDYAGSVVSQPNFTEVRVPYGVFTAGNLLCGARTINAQAPDVYHSLFHFVPFGVRSASIVTTLHDLIWIEHRDLTYEDWLRRVLKTRLATPLIRRGVRRAARVIAISNSTRSSALRRLGLAEDRVVTIHHGVAPLFFTEPAPIDLPVPPGARFIFALGNGLPYKNGPRLVRAFARLAAADPGLTLLIAGRGEGRPGIERLARQLGIRDRLRFGEGLSFAQVRACFGRAELFAFPSLVEGFGLPILEAMASGCPVVTSNRSATAEVAGDAAELVDPEDVSAIAAGMGRVLACPAHRAALIDAGRRRARQFSWERAAARTLEVYRAVDAGRSGRGS